MAIIIQCGGRLLGKAVADGRYLRRSNDLSDVDSASGAFNNLLADAATHALTLTGFNAGNLTRTGNVAGLPGDNSKVREVRVYVDSDAGGDHNELFRLTFYGSDSMGEEEAICDFFFNLTYTEVKVQWSAAAGNKDVDDVAGVVERDWIRCIGGTPETVRCTAVVDSDTLTVTAPASVHAVDEGVVRVARIAPPDGFQLRDADGTNEIHITLENVGTAFTGSTDIVIEVDI